MEESLTKAERIHDDFHGTATHAGVYLAAEHGGGRTGKEQSDFFGIEDAPGKGFPTGNELNLIQKQRNA